MIKHNKQTQSYRIYDFRACLYHTVIFSSVVQKQPVCSLSEIKIVSVCFFCLLLFLCFYFALEGCDTGGAVVVIIYVKKLLYRSLPFLWYNCSLYLMYCTQESDWTVVILLSEIDLYSDILQGHIIVKKQMNLKF